MDFTVIFIEKQFLPRMFVVLNPLTDSYCIEIIQFENFVITKNRGLKVPVDDSGRSHV